MSLTVKSILVLVVCIVAANLLLVLLRTIVELPFSDGLESAVATGVGALAWILISPRLKR